MILLLLMFLGEHDDPYAIILKHEKERHEAIMDLRSDLDQPDERLSGINRHLIGRQFSV